MAQADPSPPRLFEPGHVYESPYHGSALQGPEDLSGEDELDVLFGTLEQFHPRPRRRHREGEQYKALAFRQSALRA